MEQFTGVVSHNILHDYAQYELYRHLIQLLLSIHNGLQVSQYSSQLEKSQIQFHSYFYYIYFSNSVTQLLNKKWARRAFYLHNIIVFVVSLVAVFIVFHIPSDFKTEMNDKYAERFDFLQDISNVIQILRLKMNFETDFIFGSAKGTVCQSTDK